MCASKMTKKIISIFFLLWTCEVLTARKIHNQTCFSPIKQGVETSKEDNRISERKCKEYANKIKCVVPDLNNCKTYIEDARNTDFPHMALILARLTGEVYRESCDGILVSPRFILTTAHCSEVELRTDNLVTLVARLGDHITDSSTFDGINQVEIPIKTVYKHPKFTTPFEYHDIGLLELERDVDFSVYIRPACLWDSRQSSSDKVSVTTSMAYNRYTLDHPDNLQKFNLRVISNDECKAKGQLGVGPTQMCAIRASGLNDTHCLEAPGAPLQVMTSHNPCVSHVLGVTSFLTTICGNSPAVFARVSSYIDWIESIVWSKK